MLVHVYLCRISRRASWTFVLGHIHFIAHAPSAIAAVIRVIACKVTMLVDAELLVAATVIEFLELAHGDLQLVGVLRVL